MVTIQLKIVEEGLKHPVELLKHQLQNHLREDGILVTENSDLTLKIKFTHENGHESVLLQLRETVSKNKISEKLIHFREKHWLNDIAMESHALLSSALV